MGLASAGEQAQSVAASGVSTLHNNDTQVLPTTFTSPSSEGLAPDKMYRTYHDKLHVHESQDICMGKSGVGVRGSVGNGVGKGSHDKYIGKSGLHVGVGGVGLYGVGGLGVGGSGTEL